MTYTPPEPEPIFNTYIDCPGLGKGGRVTLKVDGSLEIVSVNIVGDLEVKTTIECSQDAAKELYQLLHARFQPKPKVAYRCL